MTLPPSPQSLFSVDIPPDFIEEYEERQNHERICWRRRAREARDRRLMDERSAAAPLGKSPSRPSVQAAPIAAGSGPRRLMGDQSAAAPLGKSPIRPGVQAASIAAGSGPRKAIEVGYLLFNLNNSQFVFSSLPVLILIPR